MAVLKEPSAEVLIASIGKEIAQFHKAEAARILAASDLDKNKVQTFYWRGNASLSARKASGGIAAVPDQVLFRPPASIGFVGGKKSIIAEVAAAAAAMFARIAPVKTGFYSGSMDIQLNGRSTSLTALFAIAEGKGFSEKETVTLFPTALYASKLESDYYKKAGGIMLRIATAMMSGFGSEAAIRFEYVPGRPYTYPAIRIGAAGAFASGIAGSKPGRNSRRRARKKAAAARGRK